MRDFELVVARHQENLNWLRRVPPHYAVAVYNKGCPPDQLPPRRHQQLIPLPNVGREDSAYLSHIVDRYETLADLTVFAQGKPFDHVPSFHRHLRDITTGRLRVRPFAWLGFIIDEDDAAGRLLFQKWVPGEVLPLRAFWHALWGRQPPTRVVFYPSAHFAVRATHIRAQPRSFYEKALQLSQTMPHAAHCFERTWDQVFAVDGVPPAYRTRGKPVYLRNIRRLQER